MIESWERAIDRTEERNLEFYAPKEYKGNDELIHADLKLSKTKSSVAKDSGSTFHNSDYL